MAAVKVAEDGLALRAKFLRESLEKSESITNSIVSALGSFDHRLSTLESAMRPTQVRTHAIRKAHENIDKTLKSAEVILAQFDRIIQAEARIMKGPRNDLMNYLEAVEQLRTVVHFFNSNKSFKSSDGALSNANSLLSKAVVKLEDEFKQLLAEHSKSVDPRSLYNCLPSALRPSSDSPPQQADGSKSLPSLKRPVDDAVYTLPTILPPKIVAQLHELAQQMVQAARQQQCIRIYREVHAKALEESIRQLQVEKLNREDVHKMPWETLEQKIGNWIHVMRIAVKLLFAGEKKVCDEIFDGMDSVRYQCFADVTSSSLVMLLSFGDAVANSKRSPEKLFVLLDMYEIMCELQPEIEKIFEGKPCTEMRQSAMSLTKRLAQTAQETFGDFEEAVEKDTTKTAVVDGTVHPLTSYVINYVKFLFDYQSTLKQLFQESNTEGETNSKFAAVTMRIMQALQSNLESKSKQYKDPALTYLFLMNNIHYMVRSVRRSEAKDLLGDDWIQRHRRIVQQNANMYKRVAWSKWMHLFADLADPLGQGLTSSGSGPGDGSHGSISGASRTAVKERFKSFNSQFEEIHQRQSQWTVPDPELKESLRLAVAEVLLPAYRSFSKRFGALVEGGKTPQKYIRYTPEDLERLLGDLFESGNANKSNQR